MFNLEPQHTLFDSVDHLLAPATLSSLLGRSVSRVECRPMNGHSGLAGGQLSYVDTDAGRFVLKQMAITADWVMFCTDDYLGRSVRLWQYGLLDELLPHLEHKIIAAAHDGDGWAILMEDLTGHVYTWDRPLTPEVVASFLDALARLHATFWNDPRLTDPCLGLAGTEPFLEQLPRAQNYNGPAMGVIADWIKEGWAVLAELLASDVFAQMRRLIEEPQPLLAAVSRYPHTLLHGDYRAENLAYDGWPIALDWQQAARSLMTIDLAWITKHGYIQAAMSQDEAIRYYRQRLELYLNQSFDDSEWQVMVDLGYAIDALRFACFAAFFYKVDELPERRAWNERVVNDLGQMVMGAMRWLEK